MKKIENLVKDIQKTSTKAGLLKDFLIGQNVTDPQISKEFLEPYVDQLLEAVHFLDTKEAPVLLSVFATGDMTKLLEYSEDKLLPVIRTYFKEQVEREKSRKLSN